MRVKFITILCIINIAISSYIMNFVFSTEAIANIENIAQEEISHIGSTSYGSYLKSRHAENIGDFTSAASFTAQLLSTNPEIKGITRRGQILMISSGRIDEAAKFAEIIIRNNESDPLANITLAVVAFKNKNFNESISRLNKIPREGLQALIVPLLTGWALAGTGSRDKALDEIKKLRNIDGMGPIIGFHSGSISELYADYSSAENYYMKGIKESVGIPALKIIESYVGYLLRSKQYDRASSLVKKFISENPKQLLIETTNLALEKGQAPEKLVKVYEHGAAEALSSVASMLKKEKLKQEALIMVQLAIYLRSDSPSILFLLGQILEENKQIKIVNGDLDIFDGISVHHVGGHSPGLQIIRVRTLKGWAVLAVDSAYVFRSFESMIPPGIHVHVDEALAALDKVKDLADSPKLIFPGHDSETLSIPEFASGVRQLV